MNKDNRLNIKSNNLNKVLCFYRINSSKRGTWNTERGTWNTERGTRYAEHGTRYVQFVFLNFLYCETSIKADTTLAARSAVGMLYQTPLTPNI